MKHEIKQSFQSYEDVTVITHGTRRPIILNLETLKEFRDAEKLQWPDRFTVIIDQRSPLRRMHEGDSFYNPNNTKRGIIEEAIHIPVIGFSSPRRATVQVQAWPCNLQGIQESILKHELQHLGDNRGRAMNARTVTIVGLGSIAYYLLEKMAPIIPGTQDNMVALGVGFGINVAYNLSPRERAAIKSQFRKLSKPLLIKE